MNGQNSDSSQSETQSATTHTTNEYSMCRRKNPCPLSGRGNEYTCEGILLENGNPSSQRIVHSYQNGCFQHIMFLGVSGYVICNHCDKEILVVDPWPTYYSYWTQVSWIQGLFQREPTRRPLTDQNTSAKSRIAGLASFLRNAVQMGYKLSGILLSHMHFDHSEDIVLLIELLAANSGNYTDHANRRFSLSGDPVPYASLPKICCDFDSMFYLLTYYLYVPYSAIFRDTRIDERRYFRGNGDLKDSLDEIYENVSSSVRTQEFRNKYAFVPDAVSADNEGWKEIVDTRGRRLFYDDTYNEHLDESDRCQAGQECEEFTLDGFKITPYVWDHMNTGSNFARPRREAQDEQTAGRLQRMTAFLVQNTSSEDAKKTFIVGSAGEMNSDWTDALTSLSSPIEAHLLILAITRPRPSILNFQEQIDACLGFMVPNTIVRDAIILCHFEEFVQRVASRSEYIENFNDSVGYNVTVLRNRIEEVLSNGEGSQTTCAQSFKDVLEGTPQINYNRLYVLGRHGQDFELNMPANPLEFKNDLAKIGGISEEPGGV